MICSIKHQKIDISSPTSETRAALAPVKTNSVTNIIPESGAWVTFLCFYWNVTCTPEPTHNYFLSERPTVNVLDGFLTQSFILLMMQRSRLYDNFRCKALIITFEWIPFSCAYRDTKCNVRMLLERKKGWKVQIIMIKWELLCSERALRRKNISKTVHNVFSPHADGPGHMDQWLSARVRLPGDT